jgi:4a-hydroxytetrahydrobiopterin dehydratase
MELRQKTCIPCQGGIAPLSRDAALTLLRDTPGWELDDRALAIERTFHFASYRRVLEFVQRVGELAEAEGHHPVMTVGWDFCTVRNYTFKINGLHENDFILAAKVNDLALVI